MSHFHVECKYCDNTFPPMDCDGDLICSRCGAEWADAKIRVEMSDEEYNFMMKELDENIDYNAKFAHLDDL